jgi:hypothetical protein
VEFREDRDLPQLVLGPVDLRAFTLFAARCLGLATCYFL